MPKYRKKPVVIEAFKLGVDEMPQWFKDACFSGKASVFNRPDGMHADICTLEGLHHANYGDYIIKGVKGELYPCKPDIFEMTYDKVEE